MLQASTAEEEAAVCPICLEVIVEDGEGTTGQDALFCEGSCHCWLHRRCAGVSKPSFERISKSVEPYHCRDCLAEAQERIISSLQVSVASLRAEVEQLKTELQKVNAAGPCGVDHSSREASSGTVTAIGGNKLPWATVVSRGSKGSRRKKTITHSLYACCTLTQYTM